MPDCQNPEEFCAELQKLGGILCLIVKILLILRQIIKTVDFAPTLISDRTTIYNLQASCCFIIRVDYFVMIL